MNTTVFHRPEVLAVLPFIRRRQTRGFELRGAPRALTMAALDMMAPCVKCSNLIHPFRLRAAESAPTRGKLRANHAFVSLTCTNAASPGCNRSGEAREAASRLDDEIDPQLPIQGALL